MPQEIDFFKRLQEQSNVSKNIIDVLHRVYMLQSDAPDAIKSVIQTAEEMRSGNLMELGQAFLTPVDKESISRAYINLDWVVMSVKHLVVELEIYEITELAEYKIIFDLLKEQMENIHAGFGTLNDKTEEKTSKHVYQIIHCDNELIGEYARQVSILLSGNEIKKIIARKEILNQLKEISKRIRLCANDLEDIVFKMS